jgi:hypothetical protein
MTSRRRAARRCLSTHGATWRHDGSNLRFFLNGTQVATLAQTGAIATSAIPTLGGDTIYGQHFQGLIDEVHRYSAALTPAQIQADITTPISGSFRRSA